MTRLGMPRPCPAEVLLEAAEVVDGGSVNRALEKRSEPLAIGDGVWSARYQ
jgi:hypothetical protein